MPWMKLSRLTRISIESVTLCWSASVIVVVWNSDTCQASCAANRERSTAGITHHQRLEVRAGLVYRSRAGRDVWPLAPVGRFVTPVRTMIAGTLGRMQPRRQQ